MAGRVDAQHARFAGQIPLDPVNDRLSRKAGASGIGEDLHDDRFAGGQADAQIVECAHVAFGRAKEPPCSQKQPEDEQNEPNIEDYVDEAFDDLAHGVWLLRIRKRSFMARSARPALRSAYWVIKLR